ncbi:hypothetical protein ACIA8O_08955 [Kitasatospora sp. NPDC051853]|uniref:hypothetical protein n=1 Tax=Kitasatospora sp. NPDC051853 TaxID=3364058 RepID=UPI003796C654
MTTSGNDPFHTWLAVLAGEPELGLDPAWLSDEALAWLRAVRDAHGEVAPPYVPELMLERRAAVAETALAALRAAAERDLGSPLDLRPEVEAECDYDTTGSVAVFGEQVRALGPEEAKVTVADAVQTFVAHVHRTVWPTCPDHRTGLHPELTERRAVWHCRAGGHDLPMP